MMYTFFEQLQMAVYFTFLGFFMTVMIDVCTSINFKNKVLTYFLQIIFWVVITFVVINAVLKISFGYIPIYTFLFFLVGFYIYRYVFRKEFVGMIAKIKNVNLQYRKKYLPIIIPIELWNILIKALKRILKIIFKKKKKVEETPS